MKDGTTVSLSNIKCFLIQQYANITKAKSLQFSEHKPKLQHIKPFNHLKNTSGTGTYLLTFHSQQSE